MCHDRSRCVVSLGEPTPAAGSGPDGSGIAPNPDAAAVWRPIAPGENSPGRSEERLTWAEHDHTCISEVIASPLRSGNNLWASAADDNSGQQKGTS
jgi:hypothetical protein